MIMKAHTLKVSSCIEVSTAILVENKSCENLKRRLGAFQWKRQEAIIGL